jgi:hypothetical protein
VQWGVRPPFLFFQRFAGRFFGGHIRYIELKNKGIERIVQIFEKIRINFPNFA